MSGWKLLNVTKEEMIYNNSENLFTFYEILCFLIKVKYWKSNDIIIITNDTEYITWIDYRYLQKFNVDDFKILNVFCKDKRKMSEKYFPTNSYKKITFTLELLVNIEIFCKIHKSLNNEFPLFDFKRLLA